MNLDLVADYLNTKQGHIYFNWNDATPSVIDLKNHIIENIDTINNTGGCLIILNIIEG